MQLFRRYSAWGIIAPQRGRALQKSLNIRIDFENVFTVDDQLYRWKLLIGTTLQRSTGKCTIQCFLLSRFRPQMKGKARSWAVHFGVVMKPIGLSYFLIGLYLNTEVMSMSISSGLLGNRHNLAKNVVFVAEVTSALNK